MRVEPKSLLVDGEWLDHFIAEHAGEHIIMTGYVSGVHTLDDGTTVDLTPDYVAVKTEEQRDEVLHRIGLYHVENGHPRDVDALIDPSDGSVVHVQRPFVFVDADGNEHHGDVGYAHGEHPLDEANEITADHADPRTLAYRAAKES